MPGTSTAHRHNPATAATPSDDGAAVVAVFNDRWRVIVCLFRSQDALIACSRARARDVAAAACGGLSSLPACFRSLGGVHAAS